VRPNNECLELIFVKLIQNSNEITSDGEFLKLESIEERYLYIGSEEPDRLEYLGIN
jgi:hypothetical protein